jgi:hypothetical protein
MPTFAAFPAPIELLTEVSREKAARQVRFRKVPVRDYKPTSVLPTKQIALSGTVTLIVGRKESKLFQDLTAEMLKPGSGDDCRLAAQLNRSFTDRKPMAFEDLVSCVRRQPVIADLHYGGATLVENILLPEGAEVAVIPLPYNGGRLADDGFSVAEYYGDPDDPEFDLLLVRNEPPLTAAEKAALAAVPADMLAVNVGRGPGEVACSVVIFTVTVVAEVAIVAATFTVVKMLDDHSMDHINPGAINDLGPVGAARALVNLRREILQGRTGRW